MYRYSRNSYLQTYMHICTDAQRRYRPYSTTIHRSIIVRYRLIAALANMDSNCQRITEVGTPTGTISLRWDISDAVLDSTTAVLFIALASGSVQLTAVHLY